MNYIGLVLTKDSKPAAAMGKAVRPRPGESKKLTLGKPYVDCRPVAKVADALVAVLSSVDLEARQPGRNIRPTNMIADRAPP
ncbi:hypothetical protein [Mycobacterium sp. E802]|uniref:hypothetical protein n=1 Tax=Mycobacterium sp. E802 TaxID=1834152 RepID=UPI0009ED8450|nr:hypothetical protein [Mycobacterium sp. E802]